LVEMVPALHFALGGRHDLGPGSGLFQRLARLGHLRLLEALGHEDGYLLSLQHDMTSHSPGWGTKSCNSRSFGPVSRRRHAPAASRGLTAPDGARRWEGNRERIPA